MTIDELIERLEEFRAVLGGDAEVRLMTQQHWPFENEIVGLASGEEINAAAEDDDADRDDDVADDRFALTFYGPNSSTVVYLHRQLSSSG